LNDRLNSFRDSAEHEAGLLPVSTLVLWSTCIAVGLVGLLWPRHPTAPARAPMPTEALLLTVEATNQRLTEEANPPLAQASAQTASPPEVPAVAAPSPAIAFAEPVNAPAHVVTAPRVVTTQPAIIQLTFGEGEGAQPPPEYPPEAIINGQEGTVIVRLSVDQDGRVTDAVAVSPCPWPLLNNAAVRAVRNAWRFRNGPPRSYEVSIQFQLNRHE
jgi:TonB family protein